MTTTKSQTTTEAKGERRLSVREHNLLQTAVVLRMNVEYDVLCRARWDGDCLLPFRAHETLKGLVKSGLMEAVGGTFSGRIFRATEAARAYICRAESCSRGSIFREAAGGWDEEVSKCAVCAGTGLRRSIAKTTITEAKTP